MSALVFEGSGQTVNQSAANLENGLMQQVLGVDWENLPGVIQRHYHITNHQQSSLQGEMEIHYPGLMKPLVWLIHLFGGLVFWRGKAVQTLVQKTAQTDNALYWQRMMRYPDGNSDYFSSQMRYLADHELIECIGFGFGLRLKVAVCDGDLVYRSARHFWQCGRFRLNIPDWLVLGSALIREHAVSEQAFYLDFTIHHPLWGETYHYRGRFCYES